MQRVGSRSLRHGARDHARLELHRCGHRRRRHIGRIEQRRGDRVAGFLRARHPGLPKVVGRQIRRHVPRRRNLQRRSRGLQPPPIVGGVAHG
jgi:hypothetical protein